MRKTILALAAAILLAETLALAPAIAAFNYRSTFQTVQAEETPVDPGPIDQPEGEAEDFGGGGCGGGDMPDDVEAGSANL